MLSESVLIEQARQGNMIAFQNLVEQYEKLIRSTALGMLGDEDLANDIAQEVFIRFYQALGQYRGTAKLSTYLTRIAINLSLNELDSRKRKRRWLSWAKADEEELLKVEDESNNPRHGDNKDLVQQALQHLDPEFRAVIVLRLMEGYSVKETAEMLELPVGTVASRLSRAQEKLKTILERMDAPIL